jgi:hypothetical protein
MPQQSCPPQTATAALYEVVHGESVAVTAEFDGLRVFGSQCCNGGQLRLWSDGASVET